LVRIGAVLIVLSAIVEYLDALGGIDISPLAQVLGFDPALAVASIGALKITLRLVLTIGAAFSAVGAKK
jgi:hypothetical protein